MIKLIFKKKILNSKKLKILTEKLKKKIVMKQTCPNKNISIIKWLDNVVVKINYTYYGSQQMYGCHELQVYKLDVCAHNAFSRIFGKVRYTAI